jgi:large repetitive protein
MPIERISAYAGLGPFVRTLTQSGEVGASVEFYAQNFTGTTEVEFNGTPATFTVDSENELTAAVPSDATTGPVSVVTPSGTLTALSNFSVTPTISSFSPTSGAVGTTVTITGTGLTKATKVTIGGKSASFTVNSSTQITATVPTDAATGKKISVTTAGGTANSKAAFTVT